MPTDLHDALRTAEGHKLRVWQDQLAASLAEVLGMKFGPPFSCPAEEYIAKTFRNANQALAKEEFEDARYLNLVNAKLLQCLLTIQEYDDDLLEDFKNELHRVEINEYFGTRREIETARSLIINDQPFDHPDPPDFKLIYNGNQIEIECTGCRAVSSHKYRQKISDTIGTKDGKYSGSTTALFVDITDLIHNSAEEEEPIKKTQLKTWIEEDRDIFDWEIGSVLLWSYVYDRESSKYHHAYIRTDNSNVDPALKRFLEDNYPVGDFEVDEWQFHSQN